jgi:hypothetical protein
LVSRAVRGHHDDVVWLRGLRAATMILQLDAKGDRRSPVFTELLAGSSDVRRCEAGPTVMGLNLLRPAPRPHEAALLTRAALTHLSVTGEVDQPWAESVLRRARRQELVTSWLYKLLMERPPVQDLPLRPAEVAKARRETGRRWSMSTLWADAGVTAAGLAAEAGWTAAHVPAWLPGTQDSFVGSLVPGLVRATLLRVSLSEESTSATVKALGGTLVDITRVREHLARTPSAVEVATFRDAVAGLLEGPQVDYEARRREQGAVTRVSGVDLKRLGLTLPSSEQVSGEVLAAVWLWCQVTGSHPVMAPFVDGRRLRPLLARLQQWQRATPPERLSALVEWNASKGWAGMGAVDVATEFAGGTHTGAQEPASHIAGRVEARVESRVGGGGVHGARGDSNTAGTLGGVSAQAG